MIQNPDYYFSQEAIDVRIRTLKSNRLPSEKPSKEIIEKILNNSQKLYFLYGIKKKELLN